MGMVQTRHQSMDNLVKVWILVSMDSETSTVISWMLSIHDPFAIIPKFTVLVSDFVEGSWCGYGTRFLAACAAVLYFWTGEKEAEREGTQQSIVIVHPMRFDATLFGACILRRKSSVLEKLKKGLSSKARMQSERHFGCLWAGPHRVLPCVCNFTRF